MPAIDANRSASRRAVKRATRRHPTPRVAVRRPATAPQTRRPDVSGRALSPRRPKPYTIPHNFHTESQHPTTKRQRRAINRNATQVKRSVQRTRRIERSAARRRPTLFGDPTRGLQRSERNAIRNLSALRASDPKRYDENRRASERNIAEKLGHEGEKVLHGAASSLNKAVRSKPGRLATTVAFNSQGRNTAGMGKLPTNVVTDTIDLVSNTPTGVYQTGAAAFEAAKGRSHRAKKLWHDYKKTSAVAAAASGNFKEAAHRAQQHPVSTALELSGAEAAIGRAGGAVARSGALGRTAKAAGSTARPNLKLYSAAERGDARGPEIGRTYSRDIIRKGLQVRHERRIAKGTRVRKNGTQRRPGRDPHTDVGTRLVPLRARGDVANAPVRQQLKRRIDTRVATQQRALEIRQSRARVEVKKARKDPERQAALAERARADHVRQELRGRLKDAKGAEKKHIRELVALPDDRLIDAVEASAKPRMSPRTETKRGYTSEEQASIARTLDRRARRGKPLTARQHEAVQSAVGKQIAREVAARKAGPEFPGAALGRAVHAVANREVPHLDRRAVPREAKRPSPNGPNPLTLQAAAAQRGIKLPIVTRSLSKARRQNGLRGGYGGIKTDRATGQRYHLIYFNPEHGVGARNAAIHHELEHAREVEAGRAHEPTTGMSAAEYAARESEQTANRAAEAHSDVDLFAGPEQLRKPTRISPLTSEDFSEYLPGLKARRAKAPQRVLPTEGDKALAAMRPSAEEVGVSHITRAHKETRDANTRLVADEFGVGPVHETSKAAAAWAEKERPGVELVPFKRGDGQWTMVPQVVTDRLRQHAAVDTGPFAQGSPIDRATSIFKDVVLTSASPARWLGGNVGDLGIRTLMEGITPSDVVRGMKVDRRVREHGGLQGEQASAATTGGGLYGAADDLAQAGTIGKLNVPRHIWRGWKRSIYTIEHGMEKLPQHGAVGKAMRRETARQRGDLKRLLKLHEEQINQFADSLSKDRAKEAQVQKITEDVIGRWGKVSPPMRRALSLAPFAQWLGAATRYVLVTLPVHHPIKTGILAGIHEMTLEERKRLGLSYFAPQDKRAPDYQMGLLPLKVGKNKYGPVVEGVRTSRMTSLGTAGSTPWNIPEFLMPQISSGLNALAGRSFTGEQLVNPDYADPSKRKLQMDMPSRLPVAIGAQLESMVPFASAFRRAILEQGRPADPSSTILTPQIRKKFNYKTGKWYDPKADPAAGLMEWLGPYVGPPFAPLSRVYTQGAGRDIEASQQTIETLKKWNAERKNARKPKPIPDEDFWTGRPTSKVRPKATATPTAAADFWK